MNNWESKEHLTSFSLYGVFLLITVYVGTQLFLKSENNQFYHQFMLEWKHIMLDYQHKGIPLPELDKTNPAAYMKNLSEIISQQDLAGREPQYMYKVVSENGGTQQIFILAHKETLQIYGLNKNMVDSIDKMIDRKISPNSGRWVVFPSKSDETYNAVWFYKKS